MAELDEILTGTSTNILDSVVEDFDIKDSYFYIDDNNWYHSFRTLSDSPIDVDELSNYILDNIGDFQEIKDELEFEGEE